MTEENFGIKPFSKGFEAKVPESFGRKMAFGVYAIVDIAKFIAISVGFVGLAIAFNSIYIALIGLPVAYIIAFKKIDGVDFLQYMYLKMRKKVADLPQLRMYFGEIIFNGKTYFAVLEVSGINYDFISDDDRLSILAKYEQFLNACNFPLQLVVHTEKFDSQPFVDTVIGENKTAEGYRKLIKTACKDLYYQRYFVLVGVNWWEIPSTIKDDGIRAKRAYDMLRRRVMIAGSGLQNIGLSVDVLTGRELIKIIKEVLT